MADAKASTCCGKSAECVCGTSSEAPPHDFRRCPPSPPVIVTLSWSPLVVLCVEGRKKYSTVSIFLPCWTPSGMIHLSPFLNSHMHPIPLFPVFKFLLVDLTPATPFLDTTFAYSLRRTPHPTLLTPFWTQPSKPPAPAASSPPSTARATRHLPRTPSREPAVRAVPVRLVRAPATGRAPRTRSPQGAHAPVGRGLLVSLV